MVNGLSCHPIKSLIVYGFRIRDQGLTLPLKADIAKSLVLHLKEGVRVHLKVKGWEKQWHGKAKTLIGP